MLYILLLLGVVLFLLFRINRAYRKKDFTWQVFLMKNCWSAAINLIAGVIIILSADDLVAVFPVTKLTIAFMGYAGSQLWQNLFETFNPEKATVVGVNK